MSTSLGGVRFELGALGGRGFAAKSAGYRWVGIEWITTHRRSAEAEALQSLARQERGDSIRTPHRCNRISHVVDDRP